jgi:AraC-like DNA-binding protein/ligand-binding sensor domain-containing protein
MRFTLTFFFHFVCLMACMAQPHQYHQFDNLGGKTQTLCIRSITQSDEGMMWLGAEDGLYSYDGHHLHKRLLSIDGKTKEELSLGCFTRMASSKDSLLIGCERGMLSFNLHTYTFRLLPYAKGKNVKGIARADEHWWVATEDALYCDGTQVSVSITNVFSMTAIDSYIYIGTREGVMRYGLRNKRLEKVAANVDYVTCFAPADEGHLWIGGATHLIAWDATRDGNTFDLEVPVAKTMCVDKEGNLLVGTDHGLFVIEPDKTTRHILHDARIDDSLAGDAVWSLFRDNDDNIWIGTNSGISMVPDNDQLTTYTLPSITGESTGNQLFCISRDRQGRIWMGGSNGVLYVKNLGKPVQTFRWYRMNDPQYPLRHNRVRAILPDSQGRVWIGGDCGLLLLNEATGQLEAYAIEDDTNNWVYNIEEHEKGQIVVTTFSATYAIKPDAATHTAKVMKKLPHQSLDAQQKDFEATMDAHHIKGNYLSAYLNYDWSDTILLGGTDVFATFKSRAETKDFPHHITDIQVNKQRFLNHQDILSGHITLEPNEQYHYIEIFLANFDYAGESSDDFSYIVTGQNGESILQSTGGSILLTDLKPGTYQLTPKLSTPNSQLPTLNSQLSPLITIIIQAPWYATTLAKIVYVLMVIALLYGIYLYWQQRKRLKKEREERATLLAQAKEKERQLLSDNEYLSAQLRMQLIEKSGEAGELSSDEKFLLDITRIIEQNMDDSDLNVNTLSAKSGISAKQLYRRIKAITGMTAVAYIRDQRLKKAASLLSKGSFTVSEVMYRVGFSSASYFTRCFCDEYGVPPSEYNEGEQ